MINLPTHPHYFCLYLDTVGPINLFVAIHMKMTHEKYLWIDHYKKVNSGYRKGREIYIITINFHGHVNIDLYNFVLNCRSDIYDNFCKIYV